jgi:hypothetical protein
MVASSKSPDRSILPRFRLARPAGRPFASLSHSLVKIARMLSVTGRDTGRITNGPTWQVEPDDNTSHPLRDRITLGQSV